MRKKQKIELSLSTLFNAFLLVVAITLFFMLWKVLVMLIIAFSLVSALHPIVEFFAMKHIPRWVTTFFIFAFGLSIFGFFIYLIFPVLYDEFTSLAYSIPNWIQNMPQGYLHDLVLSLIGQVGKAGSAIFFTTKSIISAISSIIIIFILCFYLLAQKGGIRRAIKLIVPYKKQKNILRIYARIEKQMGKWLLGQFVACTIVAVFSTIGLAILGVPYALILGLLVGIMELIPFGPVFAFIPAVILGFVQSSITGILVVILYVTIQQIEGHIVTPQIMSRAVGLNPIIVILSVLIGAKLAGLIGLVVAVPTAAVLSVFIQEFRKTKIRKYNGKRKK